MEAIIWNVLSECQNPVRNFQAGQKMWFYTDSVFSALRRWQYEKKQIPWGNSKNSWHNSWHNERHEIISGFWKVVLKILLTIFSYGGDCMNIGTLVKIIVCLWFFFLSEIFNGGDYMIRSQYSLDNDDLFKKILKAIFD